MAAEIGLECHVKYLDVDLADVMANPLLENIHQELAILFAIDRALSDEVAVLRVEQALAVGLVTPALVGDVDGFGAGALDNRDELHPLRVHLVPKEPIDGAAMVFVGGVDRAKNVEVDSVLVEEPPAVHHLVEGAFFAAIDPVLVVEFARTVDAQADQKIVLLEKRAPLVIDQNAVRLKSVLHGLFGPAVFFNEFNRAPEEVDLHQRRLAPLPRHRHRGRSVRLQQLADVSLKRGLRHPVLFVRVQRFFGQKEAIGAIDIAGGPARLRQQMEARR